ncbi:hypothetical protein [Glutamicibacter sp. PS]|uniref:hypothetical protein n=1 Tax=Glutamicibacter sp. PS TaxID=3075634 RepID=UPI00284984BF|nr:hypothetical protein [Glutamicibacter sp. PS]MDR4534727.1 hypothetical protein [Glutamicibacter sp. PS]
MTLTPRLTNRVVLFLVGLLLLLTGSHWVGVSLFPAYAEAASHILHLRFFENLDTLGATALGVGMLAVLVLFVLLLSLQGRGKLSYYSRIVQAEAQPPGVVEVSDQAIEHAIRQGLADRSDVVSVAVTSWKGAEEPGLRIRVQPRKAVAPGPLGHEVLRIAQQVQQRLGVSGPVLVHVLSGARSRFGREDRLL